MSIAVAHVFRRGDLSQDPSGKALASEDASYSDVARRKEKVVISDRMSTEPESFRDGNAPAERPLTRR
jgi:hypothetical protein